MFLYEKIVIHFVSLIYISESILFTIQMLCNESNRHWLIQHRYWQDKKTWLNSIHTPILSENKY